MNTIKISSDREGTSHPFWVIIDPGQNFKVDHNGAHNIACMITGVFFSRESAERVLRLRSHHFSKNAIVYCDSGHYSPEWIEAVNAGDKMPETE